MNTKPLSLPELLPSETLGKLEKLGFEVEKLNLDEIKLLTEIITTPVSSTPPTGVPMRQGGQDNRKNGRRGFDTEVDEMMVGVATQDIYGKAIEVTTDAIFTVGETINGYTPTGILDGLGAYKLNGNTVRVLANSELGSTVGYAYDLEDVTGLTGARISYFDIDIKTRTIVDAGLAYEQIYDRQGNLVTDAEQIGGGFDRFCSGQLFEVHAFGNGSGFEDRMYITGEEADNGSFWALDTATGNIWATPDLGRGAWESATALDTGNEDTIALLLGDDTASAPLYLYVGEKGVDVNNDGNIDFLERNGLSGGQLYVWKSDTEELNPKDFNGTGNSLSGSWIAIDVQDVTKANQDGYDEQGYKDDSTLRDEADDLGAFSFSRPEDLHTNPSNGTQVVFASTGNGASEFAGSDLWGTTYIIDTQFNQDGSITSVITILYDGDDVSGANKDPLTGEAIAGSDYGLRSPDNLVWGNDGLIYVQEDRSVSGFGQTSGEEASIWQLDPEKPGYAVRITEMDRSVDLLDSQTDASPTDIGNWETSGIIDVTDLFASENPLFLFDVQAHSVRNGSIGGNSNLVQGGQLLFMEINHL